MGENLHLAVKVFVQIMSCPSEDALSAQQSTIK